MKYIFKVILLISTVGLFAAGNVGAVDELQTAETPNTEEARLNSPFSLLFRGQDKQAHYIHVLNIGDEALLVRVHLIRAAQRSIYIQTFIWANDESGRYMVYELLQAAKRGVEVKIIVDRWKLENVSQLVAFMATAHVNMEVKTYNPAAGQVRPSALRFIPEMLLKFRKVNQRMHNKTFIIDNKVAITGGRNYENDYYDRGRTRNFKDRDVLVAGPVVVEILGSFMEYWDFELTIPSQDLIDIAKLIANGSFENFDSRKSFRLGGLFNDTDRLADNADYIRKTFIDNIFKVNKVQFVFDKPGKNDSFGLRGGGRATAELAKIIFEAKESIVAQTPYLVLDRVTVKGVQRLRKKNPDLDILISSNSLAATDNIYAYSFSYKQKKLFVQDLRFRVFEFKPVPKDIVEMMPRYALKIDHQEPLDSESVDSLSQEKNMNTAESKERHLCVHAKSFVIDDKIAWIGSFNLDPRSVHLNTEVGLVIWDEKVAKAIKDNILRDMAPQNSWTIGKRKEVPLISSFSGLLGDIVQRAPFIDVWPFRYTASFMLKEGGEIVPFYHDNFYKNYYSVGSFPDVGLSLREVEIRLLKAFSGVVMPII